MAGIPESIKKQIANPQPDWQTFRAVITGQVKPKRVHLAELFADQEIMQWITKNVLQTRWTPASEDRQQMEAHYIDEINYWHRIGYDFIRVSGGLDFPTQVLLSNDTAELADKQRGWADLHSGPIQSWEDYEKYPWPEIKEENLWMYQFVADNVPDGMGVLACPQSGFLEIPLDILIGYESLAMMAYDEPDLIKAVFDRCRELIVGTYKKLLDIPQIVGCFQGDDMGFKTSTLMPPEFLKTHSLPGHKETAALAHDRDKVYFLHSCGNLEEIMDYLIDEVKIDAKHSYEDAIIPVEQMYDKYSSRIGLLGGLDVHILSGEDEAATRKRTRQIIEHCIPNGRLALGSGNTIANYCKPENVLAMFDEAYTWGQ
ncbi:MAG: hypothetical protein JW936_07970 [Sedimentisphaerales bacterium]|nr:hypothetical protein [Sedimentisphaerales bacterium]